MAEPTTGGLYIAIATFISLVFGSSVPIIDPEILICSFAGGALFVTQAPHFPIKLRTLYFFISVLIGYIATPFLAEQTGVSSHGLVAFVVSALLIFGLLFVIDRIKDGTFMNFFRRGR